MEFKTKPTILVVDKERMLADLLARALSSETISAFGTTTAVDARKLMAVRNPSIAVVDSSMPGASNVIEAAIKAGAKVLAVRAAAEETTALTNAGVNEIVDRNAGFDALVEAIRRLSEAPLKVLGQNVGVGVLVTDDEDELRNVLAEYLTIKGYNVRTGKNGFDAVRGVNEDPGIQAVLLDVSMPQMGGMEALKYIMDRPKPPSVIMMTAVADREVARQAMNAGAFDYILKPFDFASIDASIVACLNQKELSRQPWWKRLTRRAE